MLKLRAADDTDADDLLAADAACFPHDYRVRLDGATWWLVERDGVLVAYAGVRPAETTPGAAYLCRAGVLPEARGHRLQRRLVRVRERWARRAGYAQVVTDTYNNPASANTLISCGYRMWSPEYAWAGDAACYWVRHLRKETGP